ncbi:ABC transporter ATP-binding protein [Haladaptatus caseinilyticus]|uniref:ABC transporter ATP-binding protein n=1 Tax=Haladaptatus caseinilyticus TaxID=2993314 RepID=UPI00224B5E94|nr:ABC transporter ATP-binding protein [Haladaptatus caseinilyticus]
MSIETPKRNPATDVDGDVVLEVRNASVTFDMERGESRVLNDVNLEIMRDEVLGVVGESGSGKSMFADSLLNAVVDPGEFSGEIIYHPEEGEPVDLHSLAPSELKEVRWEEVSFMVQGAQSAFNPTMTVRSHFWETLNEHDYDIGAGMERAREILTDLHLDADIVLDSYPHELSGGMKQRALIALSLILKPNVLVMDEPTAALDLLMQRSIISLLNRLKEKYGLTMVFITHDLSLVSDIADRLGVMYAFEFIELGKTKDILRRPAHPYTRSLLNSVPNLATVEEEMEAIPGSAPDPVDIPDGCSYHPRCPLADEQCRRANPEMFGLGNDQGAACFYPDEARERLQLNYLPDDGETANTDIAGTRGSDMGGGV